MCQMSASLMSMGSQFTKDHCKLCAAICAKCAKECEMFKDDHCKKCANECNVCSTECNKMDSM